MRLKVSMTAEVEVYSPTPALIQIEPIERESAQTVESPALTFAPEPAAAVDQLVDLYGNRCRRLLLSVGVNRIQYSAVVAQPDERAPNLIAPVETSVMETSAEILHFLLPSRYCQSDRMVKLASDMFLSRKPGYARVLAICEWLNEFVTYQYGASDVSTSAVDTLVDRRGVCRDFSHLAIAFCRAINIPARYVSGYCLGLKPPDFHAYFQAYLDGRWVSFDATELQPRPALVDVSIGRDAADCAWCTIYGYGLTKSLQVSIEVA